MNLPASEIDEHSLPTDPTDRVSTRGHSLSDYAVSQCHARTCRAAAASPRDHEAVSYRRHILQNQQAIAAERRLTAPPERPGEEDKPVTNFDPVPFHPRREVQLALAAIASCGWNVNSPHGGRTLILCPCGKHGRGVSMTKTSHRYAKKLISWLQSRPCWPHSDCAQRLAARLAA